MMKITLPDINGRSQSEQVAQMRQYLYSFAEELQWALNTVEGGSSSNMVLQRNGTGGGAEKATDPENFAQLKALIIKSADIVKAYYAEMTKLFEGSDTYQAISDFGTFSEETHNALYANGTGLMQIVKDLQTITNANTEKLEQVRRSEGYIRTGFLGNDDNEKAIIGVEVGQTDILGQEQIWHRYARFTPDRLSFYDAAGDEMAYISNRKLYINDAKITGNLELGAFMFDTTDGLALLPIDLEEG